MWNACGRCNGVEIVVGLEHVAHALGRPAFDLGAELLADRARGRRASSSASSDFETLSQPRDRIDARHAGLADGGAHIVEPRLGQRPQRLGVVEPDAADDPRPCDSAKPGQHEAVVAAGRVPGDARGLQHRHRPAAARDLARGGQAGEAAADHADVDVEVEGERPALGRRHHGRGVPGRRVGRRLGRVHVFFLSGIGRSADQ